MLPVKVVSSNIVAITSELESLSASRLIVKPSLNVTVFSSAVVVIILVKSKKASSSAFTTIVS